MGGFTSHRSGPLHQEDVIIVSRKRILVVDHPNYLPSSSPLVIPPVAPSVTDKTTEPRKWGQRHGGTKDEASSPQSKKGFELQSSFKKKYGKDASIGSSLIAWAIAV
ncbi:hypothetical protein JCGZ_18387 [Jatropha curcas]|uniref:Uncharacterized protein n=1 Tax=Jatropha curcas TaxID=180498 RepID=A0A067K1P6_JATCU|nr:hypothetical protein JCGZ_18387 [Jatropha curcas]